LPTTLLQKIKKKHKLEIIQHKALRIACGAFCSTSTAALQVECGELPLDLRRTQHEIKYAVKVKNTHNHPTKTVTEFHWTTLSKNSTAVIYHFTPKH